MIGKTKLAFLVLVMSVVSGMPCFYFKNVIQTDEMHLYTEYFEAISMKGSMSMSEFEEIERMSERVHESMAVSDFGLKNFFIGFILNPIIVIALAGLWYWLGFRLSSMHLLAKMVISLAVFSFMLYFGYVYQPYIHIIAFVAGQFRWPSIAYRSR